MNGELCGSVKRSERVVVENSVVSEIRTRIGKGVGNRLSHAFTKQKAELNAVSALSVSRSPHTASNRSDSARSLGNRAWLCREVGNECADLGLESSTELSSRRVLRQAGC